MRWSVNEARMICQRAAVGAGVPYGLAEDAAAAAAWLAAGGLPGIAIFRRCLEGFRTGHAGAVAVDGEAQGLRLVSGTSGTDSSALFAGPALYDAIMARGPGPQPLRVEAAGVDEPSLVLGCLVNANHGAPAPVWLQWRGPGGSQYQARCLATGCSLWGDSWTQYYCSGPADVVATLGGEPVDPTLQCLLSEGELADAVRGGHEQGLDVDDRDGEWLQAFSRRMLVAESDRSRITGAGAGLRDND